MSQVKRQLDAEYEQTVAARLLVGCCEPCAHGEHDLCVPLVGGKRRCWCSCCTGWRTQNDHLVDQGLMSAEPGCPAGKSADLL